MDKTESLIIEQLKKGEERAYKYLYDHHYQILCHIAEQYVKDSFLAETIVGDIIFHLWEIRQSLTITSSIRSYLVQSVRNRCIDYLNSQYNRKEIPISTTGMQDFPVLNYIKNDEYPLGRLLEQEMEEVIMKAIDRLPEECKQVFLQSRFDGKKYEEIAKSMGISINTVKYHVKHALSLLREDLSKYLTSAILILMQQIQ